jgi:hypothetical protein
MLYAAVIDQTLIQQWVTENHDPDTLREKLVRLGFEEEAIVNHISEYKKIRHAKRLVTGFVCIGVGAFLGFVSCVLTIINPIPELYNWILYGLTSIAITTIFIGLYFVFE